jgi:SAM-dependent methyltransferase
MTLATGFSAVDRTADPAALVAALDEQAALPAVRRLRATAIGLLDPRPGQRLLDAGCGTGEMTRELAALVGRAGGLVGVDPSSTMLGEAHRRTHAADGPVAFRLGDVTALDAGDGEFDGAHCERVLQHLGEPEAAMGELVRVTRSGGRVVVVDTDWGMHAIGGADPGLTARVIDCWAQAVPNGWSGRRLTTLLAQTGVRDATVSAETLIATDAQRATAEPITTMAAFAVYAGALRTAEAETWLAQLADAGAAGEFFWAVTMFAAGGTRP